MPTVGDESFEKWIDVYKKIQNGGKALQISHIHVDELPMAFETLKREGVWFSNVAGVKNKEHAEYIVKRVEKWA